MSQQSALRALDAEIHAGLLGVDLAEQGTYTAPGGGSPVAVRVMRDDVLVESFGENQPVRHTRVELVLLKADVAAPARRGSVVVDGRTFVLEDLVEEDQSITRWAVR